MPADRFTPSPAQLSPCPEESTDAPEPCRVLIVDDDDLIRARLAALLEHSEYEVEVAPSGAEALRVMSTNPCHMVLTDWEMPEMDGLALCRCLRVSQEPGYVYVLMLTVRNSPEDLAAGFAAGVDDYVVKGAPIHEILARLEVGRRIVYADRSLRASRANHRLAYKDSLTDTNNLRYFLMQLPRELARARRYRHPLSVLSCEIEAFDETYARYGFETTAALLRAFVTRAASCIRMSSDWLARTGRGEFTIVLPETAAYGANCVIAKLHQIFGVDPVSTPAGPLALRTCIDLIAVDAAHPPGSALRLENLMQTAGRAPRASQDHSAGDATILAFEPPTGSKHGLN